MRHAQRHVVARIGSGGRVVIHVPRPNLIDPGPMLEAAEEIARVLAGVERPRVEIDFTCVRSLSSLSLGVLVTLDAIVTGRGGQLRVRGIQHELRPVFRLTPGARDLDTGFDEEDPTPTVAARATA